LHFGKVAGSDGIHQSAEVCSIVANVGTATASTGAFSSSRRPTYASALSSDSIRQRCLGVAMPSSRRVLIEVLNMFVAFALVYMGEGKALRRRRSENHVVVRWSMASLRPYFLGRCMMHARFFIALMVVVVVVVVACVLCVC
jgi:hypothetical protein